jgi:hypothetical protein
MYREFFVTVLEAGRGFAGDVVFDFAEQATDNEFGSSPERGAHTASTSTFQSAFEFPRNLSTLVREGP